jgi:hypothetical protein
MPLDRLAVISYPGDATELGRRLDFGRCGRPGTLIDCVSAPRALALAAAVVVAGLSYCVLT